MYEIIATLVPPVVVFTFLDLDVDRLREVLVGDGLDVGVDLAI